MKISHDTLILLQVPSTEILYSLNATIVGLAVSSEGSEHLPQCVGLGKVIHMSVSSSLLLDDFFSLYSLSVLFKS